FSFLLYILFFFFFNDPATTEIYTLSLHDALPICYVGLPLAVEFARSGFRVTGIDLDTRKIAAISKGCSYIPDVAGDDVAALVDAARLSATTDFGAVADLDTITICVPTPLRKTKDPDMSYIVSAVEAIAEHLHP